MDLIEYGFIETMIQDNLAGVPARITAVHKERYVAVCEYGEIYARLKTKEYYMEFQEFPTTDDFVRISYNPD